MRNDTTILRFKFEEGRDEEVDLHEVARLVGTLSSLYETNAPLMGFEGQARLRCVASPRRGSIEFHLNVSFKFKPKKNTRRVPDVSGGLLAKFGAGAAIAAAIWVILFGENGLIDLLNKHDGNPENLLAWPARSDAQAAEVIGLLENQAFKEIIAGHAGSVREQASRCGADEVEIQIPDSAPVNLFRFSSWQGLVPDNGRGTQRATVVIGDVIGTIEYKGREVVAFLATQLVLDGAGMPEGAIVLWPLNTPLPAGGTVVDVMLVMGPKEMSGVGPEREAPVYTVIGAVHDWNRG